MKEATGETSMTVVTIILIGLILGLITVFFSGDEDSIVGKWIKETFERETGINNNNNNNNNP